MFFLKEYKLGLKYIEANRNYIYGEIDKTKYREQLSEVEAYATKDKWLTICKYIETHDE